MLFTHTSPLTTGLQGLLTIMMWGHHNGKLYNIGQYQRDWYAHILWTVHEVCTEFLEQHLTKINLLAGAFSQHSTAKLHTSYPIKTLATPLASATPYPPSQHHPSIQHKPKNSLGHAQLGIGVAAQVVAAGAATAMVGGNGSSGGGPATKKP